MLAIIDGDKFMRIFAVAALALVAGIAIGAALIGRVSAQVPVVYAIIDISEIADPEAYNAILNNAPAGLVAFGGRYVIRTDRITALAGVPPRRFVVIAFDNVDGARRWSESVPAKELDAMRSRAAKWRSFLVDGHFH